MIKVLVSLFYFLFLFSNAEAGESIVFAIDPTKPPMQFISTDGRTVGFEIDFINEIARYGGFTPVFKKVQWQSIFTGLVNDEFDAACASVSITEERKEILSFTIPYYTVSQAILVSRDSDIQSVADLKGKRIGAKKGTTSSVALQKYPDITIELFPDVAGAVQALNAASIDAVICDGPVAGYYAINAQKNSLKIAAILKSKDLELYGIAVKKDNKPLLNKLNRAIAALQANNKDIELQGKWFQPLTDK